MTFTIVSAIQRGPSAAARLPWGSHHQPTQRCSCQKASAGIGKGKVRLECKKYSKAQKPDFRILTCTLFCTILYIACLMLIILHCFALVFIDCRLSSAKPSLLKRAAKCASAIAMPLQAGLLATRQVCVACCCSYSLSRQQAPVHRVIFKAPQFTTCRYMMIAPYWEIEQQYIRKLHKMSQNSFENSSPNETHSCEQPPPKPVFALWQTNITVEDHDFSWINQLFLWPFPIANCHWEFQDPKMEVLYHIR